MKAKNSETITADYLIELSDDADESVQPDYEIIMPPPHRHAPPQAKIHRLLNDYASKHGRDAIQSGDLCVEVLSPNNRRRQIPDKLREYFECGVRMAWIVDSEEHTVIVYRTPDEGRILHESATLSGDEVLPGFSCLVREIFA